MRVGITLPQFRHDADAALDVARRAEATGLDGVFVFDHLWPIGQPLRPALQWAILLGALAAETEDVVLGTLVARVGVVPDALLVHTLTSLRRVAGERFVAGLGTGDSLNREENEAFGRPFPPAPERRAALVACCRRLRAAGVTTWVGGRSPALRRAAAEADGWNGWGSDAASFAAEAATVAAGREVTWGGQILVARTRAEADAKLRTHPPRPGLVAGTTDDLRRHFDGLVSAGASWAICAPLDVGTDPAAVEIVAEAAAGYR